MNSFYLYCAGHQAKEAKSNWEITSGLTMISKRNLLGQSLTDALGNTEAVPESWMLTENYGQHQGRITLQTAGPDKGKWLWSVLLDRDGAARGLEGVCVTGREANLAVEALVPKVVV